MYRKLGKSATGYIVIRSRLQGWGDYGDVGMWIIGLRENSGHYPAGQDSLVSNTVGCNHRAMELNLESRNMRQNRVCLGPYQLLRIMNAANAYDTLNAEWYGLIIGEMTAGNAHHRVCCVIVGL